MRSRCRSNLRDAHPDRASATTGALLFMLKKIFTRENLWALLLCLLLVALVILTADASPQWIYQGF